MSRRLFSCMGPERARPQRTYWQTFTSSERYSSGHTNPSISPSYHSLMYHLLLIVTNRGFDGALTFMQREAVRLSRKNDNIRPFEAGGEVELEHLARRADTSKSRCLLCVHKLRSKVAFPLAEVPQQSTHCSATHRRPAHLH